MYGVVMYDGMNSRYSQLFHLVVEDVDDRPRGARARVADLGLRRLHCRGGSDGGGGRGSSAGEVQSHLMVFRVLALLQVLPRNIIRLPNFYCVGGQMHSLTKLDHFTDPIAQKLE